MKPIRLYSTTVVFWLIAITSVISSVHSIYNSMPSPKEDYGYTYPNYTYTPTYNYNIQNYNQPKVFSYPWFQSDVSNSTTFTNNNGVFTISSFNPNPNYQEIYRNSTGDFELKAKLTGNTNSNNSQIETGLFIEGSNILALRTYFNSLGHVINVGYFESDMGNNLDYFHPFTTSNKDSNYATIWLDFKRKKQSISLSYSLDGINYSSIIATKDISAPPKPITGPVKVGMYIYGYDKYNLAFVNFSDIQFIDGGNL